MSLINGLSGLGAGLNAFAASAAADAEAQSRASLLNAAPPPAAAPQAASPESKPEPPAATPVLAGPRMAPGGAADLPAALLPIYQAAAKRTGIPIEILIAQAKQESGFDPAVVSSTGGIGLHQIQASTARDPGYGLRGIDPATLKDPAVNINFAADYLKAKAGNIDFSNPKSVDAALLAYNGGGDPNYVANVRRHLSAA